MPYNNMRNNRNYGGAISRNVNPWDNGMGGGRSGGMSGNQGLNPDALSLANSLINNILRNQGGNVPPSLLDLPSGGGGYGGGYGGYDDYDRMDRMNRIGNRNSGINRNRRSGGGTRSKGGVRKPNSKDRAKNVLAKNSNSNANKTDSSGENSNNDKSDPTENGNKESRKNKRRDSPYANIPNDLFYCHMCMKHMWDSTSFENHIKGRSHQMMKEGIEESYRLRANMIRQEAKIMEQLKSIEIDRMKRMGKNLKANNQHRDYCTMCDLHFYGNLSSHRKTEGHLNLKKFLHPRCADCSIEYPNRTDFDDHLLSPEHMLKISKKASRLDKKKNQLTILTEADELQGIKPPKEKKPKEKVEKTGEEGAEGGDKNETMETDNAEGGENAEGEDGKGEDGKADESTAIIEPDDVILDFNEGDVIPVEVDPKIPKYNHLRPLAASMIAKLECYECRLCGRYFDTEKTAEIHSRTTFHHRQFVKFLLDKSGETKIAQKRAEAAAEEEERRKRQKLDEEAEAANGSGEKMDEGSELYDPSEATGDDEEKQNEVKTEESAAETSAAETSVADTSVADTSAEVKEETPAPETKAEESTPAEETAAEVKEEEPATPARGGRAQSNRAAANKNTPRGGRGGRGRYNRY